MKIWEKAFDRACQKTLATGQKIINYGIPDVIKGPGSIKRLPKRIKNDGVDTVLLVAGKTVTKHGLIDSFIEAMKEQGLGYVIFDGAEPNPTISNVEEGLKIYKENQCGGIVAIGGGSSMDCAKIIGARVSNPKRPVEKLEGTMKVMRKLPPLYAVPTTAGTGSETTIAAVVVNTKTKHKYVVSDPKLLPRVAVLDPELTLSLPPHVTAMTGMDALTHAVEAYTNRYGSRMAYRYARKAVKLIFENILTAYRDGSDMEARENMLMASFYAGIAVTRNCVGYVHAAGHPLGGAYNLPHGQLMATILPMVMKRYGTEVYEPLAQLGAVISLKGNSEKSTAKKFINAIENLNSEMEIPKYYYEIKKEDISKISSYAIAEANRVYPVPRMWEAEDIELIYYQLANEL